MFPMVSGYYTALERSLHLGEPDAATLRIWRANAAAHELGLSPIRPGAACSGICAEINGFLDGEGLLRFRSFGYDHSFGVLSDYYGREAGLELREDIDTVLEPGMVISMEPMLLIPQGPAPEDTASMTYWSSTPTAQPTSPDSHTDPTTTSSGPDAWRRHPQRQTPRPDSEPPGRPDATYPGIAPAQSVRGSMDICAPMRMSVSP